MTAPNLVWSTVFGLKAHRQLHAALYNLAAECARRAIEEPNADESGLDRWIRMATIGESLEMLVKSTLAGINPVLLAEKGSTPTLWALIGSTRRLEGKIATVSATEAVKRLNDCRPPGSAHLATPKHVFEVRSDALHMGLFPDADNVEAALNELVTLIESVFKIREALGQSADRREFWSAKHIQIVEARQQAGLKRLLERYQELVAEAKVAYTRLIAGLSNDARYRLIGELVARVPEIDEDEETLRQHTCPACESQMWITYAIERDVQVDDSDAPHSWNLMVQIKAYVRYANCPVCGLHLDEEQMALTDIAFTLDLGIEEATSDEEQAWRDARDEEDRERRGYYDPADFVDDWMDEPEDDKP